MILPFKKHSALFFAEKRPLFWKNSALFLKKGPSFSRQTALIFYLADFHQIRN